MLKNGREHESWKERLEFLDRLICLTTTISALALFLDHMLLPSLVRQSVRRTIMKVVAVPVREDNYSYLLIDEATKKAAAIDPFDVAKVAAAAETHGVQIVANLTTHHHADHAGGNKASCTASTYLCECSNGSYQDFVRSLRSSDATS